jgi:hypothetical protein
MVLFAGWAFPYAWRGQQRNRAADQGKLVTAVRTSLFYQAVERKAGMFATICQPGYKWVQTPEQFRALRAHLFSKNPRADTFSLHGQKFHRKEAYKYVGGQYEPNVSAKCIFATCGRPLSHWGEAHQCDRNLQKTTNEERWMHTGIPPDSLYGEIERVRALRRDRGKDICIMRGVSL